MDQAPSVPHWKKAFPDFDGMTFEVPEGFEDSSWRNDACPSFVNGELGVQLYANYEDPALREVPGARRPVHARAPFDLHFRTVAYHSVAGFWPVPEYDAHRYLVTFHPPS